MSIADFSVKPKITEEVIKDFLERNNPIKENSGGSVSYYKVSIDKPTTLPAPYEAECNDIIEALGMNFAEGNIFKALWRRAAARRGVRKGGYDQGKYDAEKILFFAQRLIVMKKGD